MSLKDPQEILQLNYKGQRLIAFDTPVDDNLWGTAELQKFVAWNKCLVCVQGGSQGSVGIQLHILLAGAHVQ